MGSDMCSHVPARSAEYLANDESYDESARPDSVATCVTPWMWIERLLRFSYEVQQITPARASTRSLCRIEMNIPDLPKHLQRDGYALELIVAMYGCRALCSDIRSLDHFVKASHMYTSGKHGGSHYVQLVTQENTSC
jgi:hypothetical protein